KTSPPGVTDDFYRKSVILIFRSSGRCIHAASLPYRVGMRQVDNALPGDGGAQHEKNAGESRTVGEAPAPTFRAGGRGGKGGSEDSPQLIREDWFRPRRSASSAWFTGSEAVLLDAFSDVSSLGALLSLGIIPVSQGGRASSGPSSQYLWRGVKFVIIPFEINPDNSQIEHTGDVFSQRFIVIAISAFKVHGHRDIYRVCDSRNDLLDQTNRKGFAVLVALRLCDGPAAGRDSLCAGIHNRFGGASIPGIVKQQWCAFDVERREACGFFTLIHFVLLPVSLRAVKGVTTSNVAWSGPSAVNSSSASKISPGALAPAARDDH